MTNPPNTNSNPKHNNKKNAKEPEKVDVATLEKSEATSGIDPKNPGPVAVGEASG